MYRWRVGADAGCVRSHLRPSTRRRYHDPAPIPSRIHHDARRQVRQFIRSHMADLASGASLSIARPRDGWDEGDKLASSLVVLA